MNGIEYYLYSKLHYIFRNNFRYFVPNLQGIQDSVAVTIDDTHPNSGLFYFFIVEPSTMDNVEWVAYSITLDNLWL